MQAGLVGFGVFWWGGEKKKRRIKEGTQGDPARNILGFWAVFGGSPPPRVLQQGSAGEGVAVSPGERRARTAPGPGRARWPLSGRSGADLTGAAVVARKGAGSARVGRERRVLWWALCFPQVTAA